MITKVWYLPYANDWNIPYEFKFRVEEDFFISISFHFIFPCFNMGLQTILFKNIIYNAAFEIKLLCMCFLLTYGICHVVYI